ncbi:MAG: aminomethyl-transferring glycine dehydrogenase subunit GcvPA [Bacilli bacterium]|jgi:glycine dehydrogenase subunit 1
MMYKYFPHTEADLKEMLKNIGVDSVTDLFSDLPEAVIYQGELDLPKAHSEIKLREKMRELAEKNKQLIAFRGAGSYDVYTPAVIPALTSRQEFLTSYTPYQPEISQGTLQYIFEFQSLITELTNLDISNASVYDGATATMEAMFMATAQTRRNKVLISSALNPLVIEVLKTYARFRNLELKFISNDELRTSKEDLLEKLDESVAAVIIQNPNFFGVIEDAEAIVNAIHTNKSLLIMNVDPSTLAVLKTPGEIGADIACGDGQTLGIPKSFGGPYVGFIAATEKLLRKMPGRICGITTDTKGRRGFVLTLQAREQHIRREKANSNICSNQSLMALHTTIYMSLLGKEGLVAAAKRAYYNAHYLERKLLETGKFERVSSQPFFKEFVLKTDLDISKFNQYLIEKGFLSGLDLSCYGPNFKGCILFCATEVRTQAEIDEFIKTVEAYHV